MTTSEVGFRASLWDDSDPFYAPGLTFDRRRGDYFWRASPRFVKMGYQPKTVRLPGKAGDGRDLERAAQCRERTRHMVTWYDQGTGRLSADSWDYLIARYKADQWSPFHELKANTRAAYLTTLETISRAIGKSKLSDANYTEFRRWVEAMKRKGRSPAYIKRFFTHLQIILNYGAMCEIPECARLALVRSKMRLPNSEPRNVAPTAEEVNAIMAKAQAAGDDPFVLSVLLRWWLGLRGVDVIGQWLPFPGDEFYTERERGGIWFGRERWADGLTWAHVNAEVTQIAKVQSKVRFRQNAEQVFDLTLVPEVRERLLATPKEKRVGPVILNRKTGLPYKKREYTQAWAAYRDAAGVRPEVLAMDLRAGAASEGASAGASAFDLRDALGHANVSTTNRYVRDRAEGINRVVKLRRGEH